jgi:hypothetical protein
MKTTKSKMALALLPAIVLALTSCSSDKGQGASENVEAPRGAVAIETHKITATVIAVDQVGREVLLEGEHGRRVIFKAGPEVVNFNQIRQGDKVKATVTEETALFLDKQGPPASYTETGTVERAPMGAKPAMNAASTREVTAVVTGVDAKHRKVTLQYVDGTSKTISVSDRVNLANVHRGDSVTARVTEAMAIAVEKP